MKISIQKYFILLIPLLFLVYVAPSAFEYVFFYPDEKYYTDAVIQMMDKNECFTPYQANGAPRFKKPIITYWVLMASYKMFGVSRISSRIFFWLAGALLVLVTYLMAKSISGNKKLAITAAFITAANPLVLMSAGRSIPDILLVLFLTISAWGFLLIMLSEHKRKKYYWLAYFGAALAFEVKGFPAAAFAGASMLFLVLNPWKKIKIRELFEPFSMVVAIVVALSWFVLMFVEHGQAFWSAFFADQIGDRVSSKTLQVFSNSFLGVVNLIGFLIPWILMLFSKPATLKKYISRQDNSIKAVFGFVLSWVILVVLMSGAVFKFYDRYLLPVIPLVALFMAFVFVQSKITFKNTILKVFVVLNVIVLSIIIWYGAFILPDRVLIAGACFSLLVISAYFLKVFKNVSTEILIANGVALLYFNLFVLMYPLLLPSTGNQLVENLNKLEIKKEDKVYVYGNIRTAANIRINCENKFDVVSMDKAYVLPETREHFLVINKKEIELLDLADYQIFEGSEEWKLLPVERFPSFLQESVAKLKAKGNKYFIAKNKK
jgi:4-amino-4-deoxy-L-arabinose transferase-like glycosyltransferase